jgi:hypothetical protein
MCAMKAMKTNTPPSYVTACGRSDSERYSRRCRIKGFGRSMARRPGGISRRPAPRFRRWTSDATHTR